MSANTDVLNVQVREGRGTSHAKQLRSSGHLPAILYGHGQESVSLTVLTSEVESVVRHGGRVVDLKVESTKALCSKRSNGMLSATKSCIWI